MSSNRYQNIPVRRESGIASRISSLDKVSGDVESPESRMITRKKINRQLMQAEISTQKDANLLKNRIQVLVSEDSKMMRKIEETRRLAEKLKQAK